MDAQAVFEYEPTIGSALVGNDRFILFHSREHGNEISPVLDNEMMILEAFGRMIAQKCKAMEYRSVIGLCYEFFPVLVVPFTRLAYFHANLQYT
jgi:hypothetical protein